MIVRIELNWTLLVNEKPDNELNKDLVRCFASTRTCNGANEEYHDKLNEQNIHIYYRKTDRNKRKPTNEWTLCNKQPRNQTIITTNTRYVANLINEFQNTDNIRFPKNKIYKSADFIIHDDAFGNNEPMTKQNLQNRNAAKNYCKEYNEIQSRILQNQYYTSEITNLS